MNVFDATYALKLSRPVRSVWGLRARLASFFARANDYRGELAYREIVGTLAHAARNDWRYAVRVHLTGGQVLEGRVELDDLLDVEHHQIGAVTLRSLDPEEGQQGLSYHYVALNHVAAVTIIHRRVPDGE